MDPIHVQQFTPPSSRFLFAAGFLALTTLAAASPQITEIIDATGDGQGNTLSASTGIVVDGQGHAYVTSQNNNRVFRISPGGVVTVAADATGDGAGNAMIQPAGITADADGNVYVGAIESDRVFRISAAGAVDVVIDNQGAGDGTPFHHPTGMAVDGAGNLFVGGYHSDTVLRRTPAGVITQVIGPDGDGLGHPLDGPFGLTVAEDGTLYVSGFESNNLFRVDPDGTIVQLLDVTAGGVGVGYITPGGVAVDDAGTVYASARDSAYRIDPNGSISLLIGPSGDGVHPLRFADGIAVGPYGRVYVAGTVSSNLFEIARDGTITQVMDASGDGAGNPLTETTSVFVDDAGTLFVTGYSSANAFRVERPAPLTPLIHEPFEYAPPANVAGRAGGANLAGVWLQATSNGSFEVTSPGLAFPGLATSGAAASLTTPGGNYGDARAYDSTAFADLVGGGEVWASFVFELGPGGNLNINPFAASGNINQVLRIQLREPDQSVFTHLATGDRAEVRAFTTGKPTLAVARFVLTGAGDDGPNDRFQLWIDPTPGLALPDGPPVVDATFSFRTLSYAGVSYITEAGGNGYHAFDEWRMGPSYAAVTPVQTDQPPVASAGAPFSVNEGQLGVTLDGTGSFDPDGDALTFAWAQVAGTAVVLADASSPSPSFHAPTVPLGGETLTFQLTVEALGVSDSATVDVTVVNVNHPPVADAGEDIVVAEGAPVELDGSASFDIDQDTFLYTWVQVGGTPTVTLMDDGGPRPTFIAPVVDAGGAPGVVATLEFALMVDDGYPLDAPAPGYTFEDSIDTVVVQVTNVNNAPEAQAGPDQTADEATAVTLSGAASTDPDGDALAYGWTQLAGPIVDLFGADGPAPGFQAPYVGPGGADLTFALLVDDGFGGTATDIVTVHVQNANDPPYLDGARPSVGMLWPPNHNLVPVSILGVADPDNNATITIDAVTQDEPTEGTGDGDTGIDAVIQPDGTVLLRAERAGSGDGRVYRIHFTASDPEGTVTGTVTVTVPRSRKQTAVDGGAVHDSTH